MSEAASAHIEGIEGQTSKFARLKEALDAKGELMIRTVSGDDLELHKHNVEFDGNDAPFFRIEADDETHWIDARSVERYWVHNDI